MAAGSVSPLVGCALRDAQARTLSFGATFALMAYVQPLAYRHAYPTLADRLAFARGFGHDKAIVLFYGRAYDLLTPGGYSAWRVGGTLALMAAVFGLLAAVRALRTEEEAGRVELVLAGCLPRRSLFTANLVAIAVQTAFLWLAAFAGLLAGGLPPGGSAFLSLAIVSVIPVCAGVGALASQLAATRRLALELGGGVLVLMFLARVVADTSSGARWVRWLTPLGWAEALRPFTGAQPMVLVAPVLTAAVLVTVAGALWMRRDIGGGLLARSDAHPPRLGLLSSPATLALRMERSSLLVWMGGCGAFALVVGVISRSISSGVIPPRTARVLEKLGEGSVLTPRGYLSFAFLFFVLALSLFAVSQLALARREESEERLETLLALPVGRRVWLLGRLGLAVVAAVGLSVAIGLLAWGGAASAGVKVSLVEMLAAGANCLPVALLFLGLSALAYALVPRAGSPIAYGLVVAAFLWQLVGGLLGLPRWIAQLTPFAHVGAVPAQAFRAGPAMVMIAVASVAGLAAVAAFQRRDLLGA